MNFLCEFVKTLKNNNYKFSLFDFKQKKKNDINRAERVTSYNLGIEYECNLEEVEINSSKLMEIDFFKEEAFKKNSSSRKKKILSGKSSESEYEAIDNLVINLSDVSFSYISQENESDKEPYLSDSNTNEEEEKMKFISREQEYLQEIFEDLENEENENILRKKLIDSIGLDKFTNSKIYEIPDLRFAKDPYEKKYTLEDKKNYEILLKKNYGKYEIKRVLVDESDKDKLIDYISFWEYNRNVFDEEFNLGENIYIGLNYKVLNDKVIISLVMAEELKK